MAFPTPQKNADNWIRHESASSTGEDESTNVTQTMQIEERTGWLTKVNFFVVQSWKSLLVLISCGPGTSVTGMQDTVALWD